MKPITNKQKEVLKFIEENTGKKYTGKDSQSSAREFISLNMDNSKLNRTVEEKVSGKSNRNKIMTKTASKIMIKYKELDGVLDSYELGQFQHIIDKIRRYDEENNQTKG